VGDLVLDLLPEIVGMAVTPAAVIACLILLGSQHNVRDVTAFALVFLVNYALLCAVVLLVGRAARDSTSSDSTVHSWIGLVVGVLFLAGGAYTWARPSKHAAPARRPPAWVKRLEDPSLGLVVGAAAVLSILNPNVAILVSGLGTIVTAGVSADHELVAVGLLLAGSMIDFVVPSLLYAVSGSRGRRTLAGLTDWLTMHNRAISIGVLLAFGVLFTGRGLVQLLR
jgi:hypothetical protein